MDVPQSLQNAAENLTEACRRESGRQNKWTDDQQRDFRDACEDFRDELFSIPTLKEELTRRVNLSGELIGEGSELANSFESVRKDFEQSLSNEVIQSAVKQARKEAIALIAVETASTRNRLKSLESERLPASVKTNRKESLRAEIDEHKERRDKIPKSNAVAKLRSEFFTLFPFAQDFLEAPFPRMVTGRTEDGGSEATPYWATFSAEIEDLRRTIELIIDRWPELGLSDCAPDSMNDLRELLRSEVKKLQDVHADGFWLIDLFANKGWTGTLHGYFFREIELAVSEVLKFEVPDPKAPSRVEGPHARVKKRRTRMAELQKVNNLQNEWAELAKIANGDEIMKSLGFGGEITRDDARNDIQAKRGKKF